jgi:hypothetical protein
LAKRSRARTVCQTSPLARVAQRKVAVVAHGLHERVGDGDRDVEVGDLALFRLALDELFDVRVVDAQHAHVGPAAAAALGNLAKGLVVDAQKADGAGGAPR